MHEDLTIPFLLRTTVSKKLPIFINAGPFIGFLLKETTHSEMMTDEKFSSTNTSAYKNFDIRITVGLGLLKPFGITFRFHWRSGTTLVCII